MSGHQTSTHHHGDISTEPAPTTVVTSGSPSQHPPPTGAIRAPWLAPITLLCPGVGPRVSPVPWRRTEVRRALTVRDRRQPRGRWLSQASCSATISSCPSAKSWWGRDPAEPQLRAGPHHRSQHHGHHRRHGCPHLHQGVGAVPAEGEAPAVEGDVVASPQHRALRWAPLLGADPAPAPARAASTRGDAGVTRVAGTP